MILHPFQRDARNRARAEYAAGKRSILYVGPTGMGKTVVLSDTVASHVRHTPSPRVGWLAHRGELLTQAAASLRAFDLEVGLNGEGRAAPVQITSTQSVLARGEIDRLTLLVVDEAHHYWENTWCEVVTASRGGGATVVGATATPQGGDGRGLGRMFDSMVVVAQVSDMVALWRQDSTRGLVPCRVIKPSRGLRKGQIAQTPAAAYVKHAKGRRAVVFAPHVKAAREYADQFTTEWGIEARVVSGKTPADERARTLADFATGRLSVVVNVNVLTEGFDCPACDCVIIARSMGSVGMLVQACGRGARPSPGKTEYLVIDLYGVTNVGELGRPDADREFSLDGEGISTAQGVLAEVRLCKICQAAIEEGAEYCPRGHFNGLLTPVSAGVELEDWSAHYAGDDDGKKVERLAKWLRLMLVQGKRGRALYSAQYKFQATYKTKPDRATWDAAMRIARGS